MLCEIHNNAEVYILSDVSQKVLWGFSLSISDLFTLLTVDQTPTSIPQTCSAYCHFELWDSKSPQVSRTLLSILAVLKNVLVWMVSTHPTSEFFTSAQFFLFFSQFLFNGSLGLFQGLQINHYHLHLFQISAKVLVLVKSFAFFHFYLYVVRWDGKIY